MRPDPSAYALSYALLRESKDNNSLDLFTRHAYVPSAIGHEHSLARRALGLACQFKEYGRPLNCGRRACERELDWETSTTNRRTIKSQLQCVLVGRERSDKRMLPGPLARRQEPSGDSPHRRLIGKASAVSRRSHGVFKGRVRGATSRAVE